MLSASCITRQRQLSRPIDPSGPSDEVRRRRDRGAALRSRYPVVVACHRYTIRRNGPRHVDRHDRSPRRRDQEPPRPAGRSDPAEHVLPRPEASRESVATNETRIAEIEAALEEADAGDFASDQQVAALGRNWKVNAQGVAVQGPAQPRLRSLLHRDRRLGGPAVTSPGATRTMPAPAATSPARALVSMAFSRPVVGRTPDLAGPARVSRRRGPAASGSPRFRCTTPN